MSDYYTTDAADPDAPVELDGYHGIRPGDRVADTSPVAPLTCPLVVAAFYQFRDNGRGGWVSAILNGGEYEVNADHLVKEG